MKTNNSNYHIWEYFIIELLFIPTLFLCIMCERNPFTLDKSTHECGLFVDYKLGKLTLKQEKSDDLIYFKFDCDYVFKKNDKIDVYYFYKKHHKTYARMSYGSYYTQEIIELSVNGEKQLNYNWFLYNKIYWIILFVIIGIIPIHYLIFYKLERKKYIQGTCTNLYFIYKFKNEGLKRGSYCKIPNTNIVANLLYSKESRYMVFDYNDSFILSATRWKCFDNVYYNFKFDYTDVEFSEDKINVIRKKMKKYQKYLVDLSSELSELE